MLKLDFFLSFFFSTKYSFFSIIHTKSISITIMINEIMILLSLNFKNKNLQRFFCINRVIKILHKLNNLLKLLELRHFLSQEPLFPVGI